MINITLMLLFAKQAEINDGKKDMFSHYMSVFYDFLPLTWRIYCVAVEDRYSVLNHKKSSSFMQIHLFI